MFILLHLIVFDYCKLESMLLLLHIVKMTCCVRGENWKLSNQRLMQSKRKIFKKKRRRTCLHIVKILLLRVREILKKKQFLQWNV